MRTALHWLYVACIRPIWFFLTNRDAEKAHYQAMVILKLIGRISWLRYPLQRWLTVSDQRLACHVAGIPLAHPVMLGAGFCKYIDHSVIGVSALGFSAIVGGSITVDEEGGNPRPRMFRLPRCRSLINRMRFNNDGAGETRLKCIELNTVALPVPLVLSVSKSVKIPAHSLVLVIADYCLTLKLLYPYARWIEINISSPNSEALRNLQRREYLAELLAALVRYTNQLSQDAGEAKRKPLFVKIDPDMPDEAANDVVDVAIELGIEGIVCTNTTVDQSGLAESEKQVGGISGQYLRHKTLHRITHVAQRAKGRLTVIGVGGIATADHAWEALQAGADALQILTAVPYEGPMVVNRILRGLLQRMEQAGICDLQSIRA